LSRAATNVRFPAHSECLVVGFASGRIKATNKPFKDDRIFAITVRDGKLTNIREYVDMQALAKAAHVNEARSA